MMTAESGEYVGSAFVIPGPVRDAFYAYARLAAVKLQRVQTGSRLVKAGMAVIVKFLSGEDHLRHATLKSAQPIDEVMNPQIEQREAVRELLERLKFTRKLGP